MRGFLIGFVLVCWPVLGAAAADEKADHVMVWFTSQVCKDKLEPGTPGSSPELAIPMAYFGALSSDASSAKKQKPAQVSKYECKWVELSGFLTWTDYYHYRANLYESGWETYGAPEVKYIVERFGDASARRAAYVQRHVTLVGRFYDLCAAADRARKASNQKWVMVLGPCHYGDDNGMMLTDVRVKNLLDSEPQYLLGERNRRLIDDLPLVEGQDVAPLERAVRDWAASIKKGLRVFAEETVRGIPFSPAEDKDEIRETKTRVTDPDGYAAYLLNSASFGAMDAERAQVAVFWNGPGQVVKKEEAWGCICLRADCADRWPLISGDASGFMGEAACTQLRRADAGSRWYWD
jgi:hypothetical protein